MICNDHSLILLADFGNLYKFEIDPVIPVKSFDPPDVESESPIEGCRVFVSKVPLSTLVMFCARAPISQAILNINGNYRVLELDQLTDNKKGLLATPYATVSSSTTTMDEPSGITVAFYTTRTDPSPHKPNKLYLVAPYMLSKDSSPTKQ